ncbi:hypothetical protein C4D60_Mb08t30020 [Musa balbisiana]|uniref:Uncharacterized protein n=1 Tax=Musa balbisiana TaxID=52838 RepID=A0A4S8K7J4_MUSBA|nr:hypothetical protein C4D60_Mb08t30020 [Musa balbisiana]
MISCSSPPVASGHGLRLLVVLFLLFTGTAVGCYTSIFSFGDSIADTGNAIHSGIIVESVRHLPYGQTYFGHATGRFSDGRLIVDFIAEAMGLPMLRPYLAGGNAEDFRYGANFAFAGATALNASFFEDKGFQFSPMEYFLGVQLEWFKQLLPTLCSESNSKDILSNSLILMGEIGGNDYNYAFAQKQSIQEIRTYVPSVIDAIRQAVDVLIQLGATTLVVPGNFPIGCVPAYLSDYHSTVAEEYDPQTGCISWLNELSEYHNSMLLDELNQLRKVYPHATIIYADYYEAVLNILRSPQQFGFKTPLAACCGSDGLYNFNWSKMCGTQMSKVCSDPSDSLSWDGIHFTDAAYSTIALSLLDGTYVYPSFTETCTNFQQNAALSQ